MSFEKATRLDAMTVRTVNDKNYWTKIGVAFPAKQGAGWNVLLDAIPAPVDGQFKIMLMEPKPQDGQAPAPKQDYSQSRQGAGAAPNFGGGADSDIPFLPERRG